METKKGGKRLGAGRKPLGLKKQSVFLYVETRLIYKFGDEGKMKDKLYEFINGYGEVEISDNPKVFDSPMSNNFQDEPKQWQEHKKVLLRTFDQWWAIKKECLDGDEWAGYAEQIREAENLTVKQKALLLKSF